MIKREALQKLREALNRQAAVALLGPRQVGKTTLALEAGKERNALYLDLEVSADRDKLLDPVLFLSQYQDRLVILDEIHRMPELFQALRGLIDQARRDGRPANIIQQQAGQGVLCHGDLSDPRRARQDSGRDGLI